MIPVNNYIISLPATIRDAIVTQAWEKRAK